MKHKSDLQWGRLPLVFNLQKRMVIANLTIDDVFQIKKLIREDKGHMDWKKANMRESYDRDMGIIEFYDLLQAHGCDELGTSESERSDNYWLIQRLNRLSKEKALSSRESEYTEYKPEPIYRCGDWYFAIWTDKKNVPIDYEKEKAENRGGSRTGAGRKKKASKLRDEPTTTIRVPASFKEPIKKLIDFLINQKEEGSEIHSVLFSAKYEFEGKARDYRGRAEELGSGEYYENNIKWAEEAEKNAQAMERLYQILPFVKFADKT